MNDVRHDRKSASPPGDLPPPGAPQAESKIEDPEAFGRPKNNAPTKAPDAFGRGKPARPAEAPAKRQGAPENKHDDNEGEDKENDEVQEPKDEGPKKPPFYKRPVLMTVLIATLVLIVAAAVIIWLYERQFESTDDAFIDGHVVQISPKLAALVKAVHIDDNTAVKRGDVMIELDPRDFQAALDQAKAAEASKLGALAQSKTQKEVMKARVGEAEAQVTVAKTNADNAERDYKRFLSLDERARSQQQLDNATTSQRGTVAQVAQAQANLKAAEAQVADAEQAIKTAEADVAKAQADVRQAELNLSYCNIIAPADGRVTRKNVEPGQYVQVAQPLFSVVPTEVWVTANFKETQLDHMRVGQPVEISVDAFSEHTLHGKVDSIQNGTGQRFTLLPPENASGNYVKVVQRIPVKIVLDPGQTEDRDRLLAPGLSVQPKVRVR